jgi:lipoprotein-releasing system permease protein
VIDVALLVFLATKGLLRSRLTTALLIVAVAAGVGLQIPNSANLRGYTAGLFDEATTAGFGDVRVQHARDAILDDGDALAADLAGIPGVRAAVPVLSLPGAITKDERSQVASIHGVDPRSAYRPYRVRDGKDLAPDDEGVLVGTAIATRYGIKVGDKVDVRILFPPAKVAPEIAEETGTPSPTVAEYAMVVRGTAAGTFGADESLVVTRALLARAMARPHAATRVLLYARSKAGEAGVSTAKREAPKQAIALGRAVEKRHPELRAITWMIDHPYADSAIQANEVLGVVSHTMVVIAVTIPIASLLYVTVLNRRREIAMLAALGFTRLDIFLAFVVQALAVGAVGVSIGCVLGWGAIAYFDANPIFQSENFEVRPVVIPASFYEPAIVVLLTTVIAAALPALRATRVDPSKVLRGIG